MFKAVQLRRSASSLLAALLVVLVLPAPLTTPAAFAQETGGAQDMPMEPPEVEIEGVRLTLREALALALQNSLAISVRRYDPDISRNNILRERGAFDPSLNFFASVREADVLPRQAFISGAAKLEVDVRTAQVEYIDPTSIGGQATVSLNVVRQSDNSIQSSVNPSYEPRLTFAYSQSFMRNFGYDVNTTEIRVANRNLLISESDFRQTVINTLRGVEQSYWDLKFFIEDLAVKSHSRDLSGETLKQNQIRVDVGTMAPIDVTTAEAEVASRTQDVLLAENALQNAQDLLLVFLNQPKTSELWVTPIVPADELPFDGDLVIDVDAAIEAAYRNRPDLEQTRLALDNDDDLIARARDARRYDLVGTASYTKNALAGTFFDITQPPPPPVFRDTKLEDSLGDLWDENFDDWTLSLNLSIPLGNKVAKANYLNSKLVQTQRQELLRQQELDAVIAVRNSARAVQNTIERVKAARVNVRLQRERLAAENKRYENGMTTTFDLFQFQDDLTRAESQVVLALVDFSKALADLEAAKGTLDRARGVVVADLIAPEPES